MFARRASVLISIFIFFIACVRRSERMLGNSQKKKKKNMVITPFDRGCCFEKPYKFILSQIERNKKKAEVLTMGKIEDAIKKINTEIQKEPSNRYLALVGEHIIDNITSEAAAEKVLKEEKTLAKALGGIQNKASKQKTGNCAVIEDSVVYGWAREYFGLTANPQAPAEEAKKGVCVSLEDFL